MSYTNSTPNYNLPQWIGTDKPTFLGDFNGAFSAIDTAMKDNADASSAATSTANAANATAVSANTNANTALNTANNAKDTADAATAAAATATSTANTAKTTADNAAHAALSNNVANLAPAYDPTLTYAVGDLVTYIDENNTGKLYRCIIAVNSPMSFNVNYWDDVTASEVFAPHGGLLVSVEPDGTKTVSNILDELFPYIVGAVRKESLYILIGLAIYRITAYQSDLSLFRFSSSLVLTDRGRIEGLIIKATGSTYEAVTMKTTGNTLDDWGSQVATAAISLYED